MRKHVALQKSLIRKQNISTAKQAELIAELYKSVAPKK